MEEIDPVTDNLPNEESGLENVDTPPCKKARFSGKESRSSRAKRGQNKVNSIY